MAPKTTNGELIDHRLTEAEGKIRDMHKTIHDPKDGVLKRLDDTEEVVSEVKALKSWAQRLGLAGVSGVALAYWDSIKAALKIGGSP